MRTARKVRICTVHTIFCKYAYSLIRNPNPKYCAHSIAVSTLILALAVAHMHGPWHGAWGPSCIGIQRAAHALNKLIAPRLNLRARSAAATAVLAKRLAVRLAVRLRLLMRNGL